MYKSGSPNITRTWPGGEGPGGQKALGTASLKKKKTRCDGRGLRKNEKEGQVSPQEAENTCLSGKG